MLEPRSKKVQSSNIDLLKTQSCRLKSLLPYSKEIDDLLAFIDVIVPPLLLLHLQLSLDSFIYRLSTIIMYILSSLLFSKTHLFS